jgi:hypothetical protein
MKCPVCGEKMLAYQEWVVRPDLAPVGEAENGDYIHKKCSDDYRQMKECGKCETMYWAYIIMFTKDETVFSEWKCLKEEYGNLCPECLKEELGKQSYALVNTGRPEN